MQNMFYLKEQNKYFVEKYFKIKCEKFTFIFIFNIVKHLSNSANYLLFISTFILFLDFFICCS